MCALWCLWRFNAMQCRPRECFSLPLFSCRNVIVNHFNFLSGLTSLGCGHLTSETCFFSQERAHFGAHTTQLCMYFADRFKKSWPLFFTVLNSWLVVWSPRPERIDNVAGMRTAPRDNSAPCTVQVVCRHGALDLMPPLCPNRQERRFNPPFSPRLHSKV